MILIKEMSERTELHSTKCSMPLSGLDNTRKNKIKNIDKMSFNKVHKDLAWVASKLLPRQCMQIAFGSHAKQCTECSIFFNSPGGIFYNNCRYIQLNSLFYLTACVSSLQI